MLVKILRTIVIVFLTGLLVVACSQEQGSETQTTTSPASSQSDLPQLDAGPNETPTPAAALFRHPPHLAVRLLTLPVRRSVE